MGSCGVCRSHNLSNVVSVDHRETEETTEFARMVSRDDFKGHEFDIDAWRKRKYGGTRKPVEFARTA
jgi:hypothetical protein